MPTSTESRLQEADLLRRAVENVFRRLIRLLVGRITLVKLQEMLRFIYVDETEKMLKAERPGKNVALTRLALNTGLDTRTLARVRERLHADDQPFQRQFLAQLTPESAVVEAWASRKGLNAKVLHYGADDSSFETLVRNTISTRGITTQSIIQRLVDTRSVEQDKEKRELRLLVDHFSPYLSDDEPNIINAAFSAVSNLLSTVEHNLGASHEGRMFQRQTWTFRLAPADRAAFRESMRNLLESQEQAAIEAIEPWEDRDYRDELVTAGVGFYYFEENSAALEEAT